MMEIVVTDGTDARFVALCHELDAHLAESSGKGTPRQHYDQYNTLEHIHDVVLIVEAGQAVACGSFKEYGPDSAEIKRVFTKPDFRGRGYSKIIMGVLEKRAVDKGYRRLILETGTFLENARRLYISCGFHSIDNYGQYAGMPESLCMEKLVRP